MDGAVLHHDRDHVAIIRQLVTLDLAHLIGLQFQFAPLLITQTVFVRGYSFNPTSITIFSCFSSRFDENFTAGLWPTSDLEENLTLEMGVTQEAEGAWSPAITAQSALGGEPTHIATWPC